MPDVPRKTHISAQLQEYHREKSEKNRAQFQRYNQLQCYIWVMEKLASLGEKYLVQGYSPRFRSSDILELGGDSFAVVM